MITLDNAYFRYGKTDLFNDLSLSIPSGNIYGLLGMNGAGKTTLLKILSGQIYLKSGEAEVLGFNPQKRPAQLLSEIFYLPEEFHLPNVYLKEYLSLNSPFYPKFSREQFDRYSEIFSLDYRKKISKFSYGQKKKFLLSFGLAANTQLLILDEPTNGLDIPSKSQFRRAVASAIDGEKTFIISTHQVRDMENLIDPIIILHEGKVIFNHPLDTVSRMFTHSLTVSELDKERSYLYQDKVPGGWSSLSVREGKDPETNVDLETLFNAVLTSPEITDLLNKGITSAAQEETV